MREEKLSVIAPTRRDFLKGHGAGRPGHIASILVQAWPDRMVAIESELTRLTGVESHGSNDTGKLILTVETDDDAGLLETINRIETTDGVITALLVYHQQAEADDA